LKVSLGNKQCLGIKIVLIANQKIHSYLSFRTQWVKDFVTDERRLAQEKRVKITNFKKKSELTPLSKT